jgi:hypothetical protein
MRYALKHLTAAAVPAALDKAEQYRLLNQPGAAESICLDILAIEPGHQAAIRTMLLACTDQFVSDLGGATNRAREALGRLASAYERTYYAGLIAERRAKAHLEHRAPGSRFVAYEELREAMAWYEEAERARPAGDDDAILRWNTCARLLNASPHIAPRDEEAHEPILGE